ncbi:MAG: winged helix-turn-helix transcriptional regulator [Candidatus Aenigmarchaeota archaeon]|nr:winged helix-turn-helix transcriptional regulator [Candidatus Aenigmarchaeota archaeon]
MQIIKLLAENPRITISELSKKLNKSRATIKKKLSKLKIKYILDLDKSKLNLDFNIIIKIKLKKPIPEKLLKLGNIPQFIALTKGDFDLFIYCCTNNPKIYDKWEIKTREKLNEYIDTWETCIILSERTGFFPLKNEILKSKTQTEKIIKILNQNSRTSLKQISKETKLSTPLIKYHLNKLIKSKLIKPEITLSPELYPAQLILFRQVTFPKNFIEINKKSREFLKNHLENISFSARTIGSWDHCLISVFKNLDDLYNFQKQFNQINEKRIRKTDSAIILKIISGNLYINPYKKEYKIPKY